MSKTYQMFKYLSLSSPLASSNSFGMCLLQEVLGTGLRGFSVTNNTKGNKMLAMFLTMET